MPINRGVHPPRGHGAFPPPVSDFPPISEKFSDFLKIFYNLTFSRKISWLSSGKISDDFFFLVIDHKFRISPLFFLFRCISPLFLLFQCISRLFRENFSFPPTFPNSPPVLGKFTCFLHTLRVFFPPL